MTMYEFNQLGYASLPTLSDEELVTACDTIKDFLANNPSKYYMMLNNDRHYYTIYTFTDTHLYGTMAKEIIDITKYLGDIKSIEVSEDNQKVEFWITDEGRCDVYYLFDYQVGVVEI